MSSGTNNSILLLPFQYLCILFPYLNKIILKCSLVHDCMAVYVVINLNIIILLEIQDVFKLLLISSYKENVCACSLYYLLAVYLYIFGNLIIESMIVNMVNIIETHGQVATKRGHVSFKKNGVFSSMARNL